jgi:hypothetical protein
MSGTEKDANVPIEIRVDLVMVQAKAPLRALADVTIRFSDGEVTLKRCAVFQKAGEPAWANLPRLPIEKNGGKQFVSLIDLPRELKQHVLDAVLSEYERKADGR